MEYRYLTAFSTLARYLNFSQAAATLHITQPALSKQIAALEEELGVMLLCRENRNIQLTAAGRAFLPEVEEILQRTANAILVAQSAQAKEQLETGSLSIAYDSTLPFSYFSETTVTDSIAYFKTAHPHISMEFCYLSLKNMESAVKEHRVDIGFTLIPRPRNTQALLQLRGQHSICSDHWVLVVPRAYAHLDLSNPDHRGQLDALPLFIQKNDPAYLVEGLNVLSKVGLEPTPYLCDSWQETEMRTEMGGGYYLLLSRHAPSPVDGGTGILSLEGAGELAIVDVVAFWDYKNEKVALAQFVTDLTQSV